MKEIIEFLNNFGNHIEVIILEDNKYEVSQENYNKDKFIELLNKLEFIVNGVGSREFYIQTYNGEFTVQVSDFDFSNRLILLEQ